MKNLSIVIITKNEENNLKSFLSHLHWADEIIVIDNFSNDGTVDICKEFKNVKFFQNKFIDYSAQRNYGIKLAKGEWILSIDPDEIVSGGLKGEIEEAIKSDRFSAYRMPFKNYFYGKWLKHGGWYPDYHVRLFKKDNAVWEDLVHEKINVNGVIGSLKEPVAHLGHKTVKDTIDKLNLYTDMESFLKISRGVKFSAFKILFEPFKEFTVRYFLRLGFLDGFCGFVVSFYMGCYRFFIWAKIYQLEKVCNYKAAAGKS